MTWLVFALGIVLGWCVRAFPSRSPAELLEPVRRRRTLRAWNAGTRGIALMPARADDALEAAGMGPPEPWFPPRTRRLRSCLPP